MPPSQGGETGQILDACGLVDGGLAAVFIERGVGNFDHKAAVGTTGVTIAKVGLGASNNRNVGFWFATFSGDGSFPTNAETGRKLIPQQITYQTNDNCMDRRLVRFLSNPSFEQFHLIFRSQHAKFTELMVLLDSRLKNVGAPVAGQAAC